VGEIAAKTVVQLLFTTGKSFTVDGLREKLREFFPAGGASAMSFGISPTSTPA
jgi:hypothetical protein